MIFPLHLIPFHKTHTKHANPHTQQQENKQQEKRFLTIPLRIPFILLQLISFPYNDFFSFALHFYFTFV